MPYTAYTNAEYAFGAASEREVAPVLYKFFGVKPTGERFAKADFSSSSVFVELKTRRCMSTTYEDFMMTPVKLVNASQCGKDAYFVFRFYDGLYYWLYDPTVTLRSDWNGRQDRGRDERKTMYYIPRSLLTKLNVT